MGEVSLYVSIPAINEEIMKMEILLFVTSDKLMNPGNDDQWQLTSQKKNQADVRYLLMEMY